jgi:hypothetical protein
MPLCEIFVSQFFPENQEYHSSGSFVIDTSLNTQDEILALLSDADKQSIGAELGVIHQRNYPMPSNVQYHLSGFALNPIELPEEPTFTSEMGYKVWVKPSSDNDF